MSFGCFISRQILAIRLLLFLSFRTCSWMDLLLSSVKSNENSCNYFIRFPLLLKDAKSNSHKIHISTNSWATESFATPQTGWKECLSYFGFYSIFTLSLFTFEPSVKPFFLLFHKGSLNKWFTCSNNLVVEQLTGQRIAESWFQDGLRSLLWKSSFVWIDSKTLLTSAENNFSYSKS